MVRMSAYPSVEAEEMVGGERGVGVSVTRGRDEVQQLEPPETLTLGGASR